MTFTVTAVEGIGAMDLMLGGTPVDTDDCSLLLFHPEGGLVGHSAATRKLRVRLLAAPATSAGSAPANYYDVIVSTDSAASRVIRP